MVYFTMESSLKDLTIQIQATCWLVFFVLRKLSDQRGLKTRSTTAKQIYQPRGHDGSKCSDTVCTEGQPLVLHNPNSPCLHVLFFYYHSNYLFQFSFFSKSPGCHMTSPGHIVGCIIDVLKSWWLNLCSHLCPHFLLKIYHICAWNWSPSALFVLYST